MLKPVLILAIACICCVSGRSQPGFNYPYELNAETCIILNTVAAHGKIYAYGALKRDTVPAQYGVALVIFDTNGVVQSVHPSFPQNGRSTGADDNYSIRVLSDGNIALSVGYFSSPYMGLILVFDPDGNLLWQKDIPYSSNHSQRELVELSDGFLLGGSYLPPAPNNTVQRDFVARADKQGNVLWYRSYGDVPELTYNMQYLDKLDNNTFVIGSVIGYSEGMGVNSWSRSRIYAIDSLGDVKWDFQGPILTETVVTSVQRTPDARWLYTTNHLDTAVNRPYFPNWSKVICRDSAWNLLWEKNISPNNWYRNQTFDMKPTPDGNYVVAARWAPGPTPDTAAWIGGCLYKFTPDGQELWRVCDTIHWGIPGAEASLYVGGLTVLPSGSVVLAGRADRWKPTPTRSFGWLYKVDANGCMYAPCTVSADEPAPSTPAPLWVYPNPASDWLTVRLPDLDGGGVLEAFDALGRPAGRMDTAAGQEAAYWEVGDWAPGLYALRLSAGGRVLAAGRVLVGR